MKQSLSGYLNAARFLAAFSVLLCHFSENWIIGPTPFFDHLGAEGVGVFFVLSGFVIGYVTDHHERDLRTYAVNRLARIYSVVLPCLAAGLALDMLGRHFLAAYYAATWPPIYAPATEILRTVLSLAFVDQLWFMHWFPGSNPPFWSLCYEVPYYILFGVSRYMAGWRRKILLIGFCLIAGPPILLLYPLWLAGLHSWRLTRRLRLSPAGGKALLAASVILWGFTEALRWRCHIGMVKSNGVISWDGWQFYLAGLLFAASVIGVHFSGLSLPRPIAAIAGYLAGTTFTLYLLHFPLSKFLNGLLPAGLSPGLHWALLLAPTLVIVLGFAACTERRKAGWRRLFSRVA